MKRWQIIVVALGVAGLVGCKECRIASDCAVDERCYQQQCIADAIVPPNDTNNPNNNVTSPDGSDGTIGTDSGGTSPLDQPFYGDDGSSTDSDNGESLEPGEIVWITVPGTSSSLEDLTNTSNEAIGKQWSVKQFDITQSEITVAQYHPCVEAGVCAEPTPANASPSTYHVFDVSSSTHPVNFVNWEEALTFCNWVGGFLPSETQWEYAATGGGQDIDFPWGDEPSPDCSVANIGYCTENFAEVQTTPVCSIRRGNNSLGLCDMTGNLWEWANDTWETGVGLKAMRSGSWSTGARYMYTNVGARKYGGSVNRYADAGIRCARNTPVETTPVDTGADTEASSNPIGGDAVIEVIEGTTTVLE